MCSELLNLAEAMDAQSLRMARLAREMRRVADVLPDGKADIARLLTAHAVEAAGAAGQLRNWAEHARAEGGAE